MLNFHFHNPTAVYFGKGQIGSLSGILEDRFRRVLIVTGRGSVKRSGIFEQVTRQVTASGAGYAEFSGICPNPRLESVRDGISRAREYGADLVLAVGGGSVIDAAKTISAGVHYDGDVWDLFISGSQPRKSLPVGTVLTLSATGSEMNPNAVITNERTGRKLAFSSPLVYPVFSIMDPEYTYTVDRYNTAAGIADIMAHVFEYYLTPLEGCFLQDSVDEAILKTCVEVGPRVLEDPRDYDARANIMWASTLALNGISGMGKTADFTLHMIEHEVSAITDLSHGAGLAILIPGLMEVMTLKYGPAWLSRYARNVFGIQEDDDGECAKKGIKATGRLFASMGLPSRLSDIGVRKEDLERIAAGALETRHQAPEFEQLTAQDIKEVVALSL
jgi:hypothetical protein